MLGRHEVDHLAEAEYYGGLAALAAKWPHVNLAPERAYGLARTAAHEAFMARPDLREPSE